MANSNPSILSAGIPTEAQPNNRFTFSVRVKQDGPDPWASDGSCTTSNLDVAGWRTPVVLYVNGEEADTDELCLKSGTTGEATLSTSLPAGEHSLKVAVDSMGGNAYDLQPVVREENDSVRGTVRVSADASDPSRPTTTDRLTQFVERIASALGGTTQQVAAGFALAVIVLVVV